MYVGVSWACWKNGGYRTGKKVTGGQTRGRRETKKGDLDEYGWMMLNRTWGIWV